MKIKNCVICQKEFESHYGAEICSDGCYLERKRLQNKKGNDKRYSGRSKELETIICKRCEKSFLGLGRRYCDECSATARKESQKQIFNDWYAEKKKSRK